ncbi:hypothetical protein DSO57_1025549 [Entomophthora muscae]|uniref:Uncharacterized protein n=1 Tax=Entomophthora muscae TaxID=34485 RepID=A0ACC2RH39_9FUNG|nr:hypothetical protein DSO57_1025549 [Entomophthora muscae]
MTPPLTLQPDCLQEFVATSESTSTQIFGVLYITITSLIDSMVPTSGPWAILEKSLSYIVKLALILWWALLSGPAGCPPASSQEPTTGWIPERSYQLGWHLGNQKPSTPQHGHKSGTAPVRANKPIYKHQRECH